MWNRIDTCESGEADRQVNATTNGNQYPTGASLARLASGLYVAAWVSEADTSVGANGQLRAALIRADGSPVPGCDGANGGGDVAISLTPDREVGRPVLAVAPMPGAPIFFAWRSAARGGQGEILVRLMQQDLCPWNPSPNPSHQLLRVSDDSDDPHAPALAVRADGREALVAWASVEPAKRIRSRPVGITMLEVGQAEMNPCTGADEPCTHTTVARLGVPALVAHGAGYALAWTELRADGRSGFDVRLQILDHLGVLLREHRGARAFGDVLNVDLALGSSRDQVLVVEAAVPRAESPDKEDAGVHLERFGPQGSLGPPARIMTTNATGTARPALALVRNESLFVAWRAEDAAGQSSDIAARLVGLDGAPRFTGMACGTDPFPVSSHPGAGRVGVALAASGAEVLALFGSDRVAPGGSDGLGLSVHARRFDLERLVPGLP